MTTKKGPDAEGENHYVQKYAFSKLGMIATAHPCATDAGIAILAEGGNAFDAAVAAAFTLGVCEPMSSGLGGQTMMLVHDAANNNSIAIDGSSRVPNRATLELLSKKEMRRGHRATTVPSTPAVLDYVADKYGSMGLKKLLAPAITAAEEGYRVSDLQDRLFRRTCRQLAKNPSGSLFLKDGDVPYAAGDVFKQPVLAATLRRLAAKGIADFYSGQIADAIVADMAENDGLIQHDDLARIPVPIERRPISVTFMGQRVLTFPPPGAGRALAEMINMVNYLSPTELDIETPKGALVLAKVIQQAQIDRRDRPFNPNYYHQISEEEMLSPKYAKSIARSIKKSLKTAGETTHLSVIDKWSNIVALTQSIETTFGSCTANPKLGFLYNNYMSAFEYEDISHPYYLHPNGVPWASVAPTLIFRGQHPIMAIGSPGSERIAPSILQVMLRLESCGPLEAVNAPRLHCSFDGTVSLELSRMRSDIAETLTGAGYTLNEYEPYSFYLGCVQLAMKEKGGFAGVADPRRDGTAGGP